MNKLLYEDNASSSLQDRKVIAELYLLKIYEVFIKKSKIKVIL